MKLPEFPVEGGCQCGARALQPQGCAARHLCATARIASGSPGRRIRYSMVAKAADVELIAGELAPFDKAADSGRTVRMLGCMKCGTKVWNEPLASPQFLIMKPGTLDDMSWAKPVGNIWTDRAQPWTHIDPDVPNFPGQPADRQPLFDAFAAEVAKGWRTARGIWRKHVESGRHQADHRAGEGAGLPEFSEDIAFKLGRHCAMSALPTDTASRSKSARASARCSAHAALAGSTADNPDWLRRKANVVHRRLQGKLPGRARTQWTGRFLRAAAGPSTIWTMYWPGAASPIRVRHVPG